MRRFSPAFQRRSYVTNFSRDGLPTNVLAEDVTLFGKENIKSSEYFTNNKTVVMFGLPGAYTPVCSNKHVPSFIEKYEELKKLGVDDIACLSVNDKYVMEAWGKSLNTGDKVRMLGDPLGDFVKSVGLDIDLSAAGLGVRSKRFSMIVKNGKVVALNVEESPADFKDTGADVVIDQLKQLEQ